MNIQHLSAPVIKLLARVALTALASGIALPALAETAMLSARNAGSPINIRSAASTLSAIRHYGLAGDRVEILDQSRGADGFRWYRVRFNQSGAEGWVREDLVQTAAPLSRTEPPARISARTTQPTINSQPIASRSPGGSFAPGSAISPTQYTRQQIEEYFGEVALGAEFGSATARIRKWNEPMRIKVHGSPTQADLATLNAVVNDLNRLTGLGIVITNNNPNMDIHFAPESEFSRIEPNYRPRNLGYVWVWWNNDSIYRGRTLISTTGVTQAERSHLIREELTQSLGLMRDSYRYSDSIFYQGWTETQSFSAIDEAVIALLYRPELRPGMSRAAATAAIARLSDTTILATACLPQTSTIALDFSQPPRCAAQ